tara:strand:+ start:767 stop:1828 length:1062 start_codon:yes stop_codon:yes gene_type:complete
MALWGKNDNIPSVGTVSLDWTPNADGTHTVTGSATPTVFGTVGAAKTGDVIRFGLRDGVETAKYFGDAVIVGIESGRLLTIGSTAGLVNAAIANTSYYISELPSYTVVDSQWSNTHDSVATYKNIKSAEGAKASDQSGVGSTVVGVQSLDLYGLAKGDALYNNATEIVIGAVGSGTRTANATAAVGLASVYAVVPPGINLGDTVDIDLAGVGAASVGITKIEPTYVGIAETINTQIAAGAVVTFRGDIVSLEGTVASGIATGDSLIFRRKSGGYDRNIYGISTTTQLGTGSDGGDNGIEYITPGAGYVGVTTFMDCEGHLRVKSEILVAIGGDSGITTGANSIAYPTNRGAIA